MIPLERTTKSGIKKNIFQLKKEFFSFLCYNIQHNDTQHDDPQHNDTKDNDSQHTDIQDNGTEHSDTLEQYKMC
jgi:hypothetical protein